MHVDFQINRHTVFTNKEASLLTMRSLLLLITITLFQRYSCVQRYIPHHGDINFRQYITMVPLYPLDVDGCNQTGELRLDNQRTMNTTAGAVQVCTEWERGRQQWRYFSESYWTNTTAKKACQQLGLGYSSKEQAQLL